MKYLLILLTALLVASCADDRVYYQDIETGHLYHVNDVPYAADTVVIATVPSHDAHGIWGNYTGFVPPKEQVKVRSSYYPKHFRIAKRLHSE